MYRSIILFIGLLGGVLHSANVAAQVQDSVIGFVDYEYVKNSKAWLSSYNAAGLYALSVKNVSRAQVYGSKGNGKFINYFESDNNYKYGLGAESFYRLDKRMVLYGKIGYEADEGRHMLGSAFINPYDTPFDIVEYNEENAGKKKLERYHLVGALSVDMGKGLTLGGKIDYLAANYAKMKDLRHVNKLMDMSLTLGATYKVNSLLEIGGNYFYRRSTEEMKFTLYGSTGKVYYSLINFGSFYGRQETRSSSENSASTGKGYTRGDAKPLFNEYHGGSLQLNFNISPSTSFFNELTYKSRSGYYGVRSSASIVYSEHSADILEYKGVFSFSKNKSLHNFSLNIASQELENNENVYRENTPVPGGATVIDYYGQNKMLDQKVINAQLKYTGYIDVENNNPLWTLSAGVDFYNREQTTSLYPFYRKQDLHAINTSAGVSRNIVRGRNMYTAGLGLAYSFGGGNMKTDGIYTTPTETQQAPFSLDNFLEREYEYLTNSHLDANVAVGYSRIVDKNLTGYVTIDYGLRKGFDVKYLPGSSYGEITLKVGCLF